MYKSTTTRYRRHIKENPIAFLVWSYAFSIKNIISCYRRRTP